jgi:hypothetical protein
MLERIVEVLKSEKLDLVDFLFLSGQEAHLAAATRVQMVSKGKLCVSVMREKIIAFAQKGGGVVGFLSGRRSFMSCITREGGEGVPEGLNFYERAVYTGAGERWFPEHKQAVIAAYNRQGLMKENSVGYRGEDLRKMYQEGVDALMSAVKAGGAERARLLNEHAMWHFAFFALPLPLLEPKALKAFRARRNGDYLECVMRDALLVSALNDAAVYAVAEAEAIARTIR